MLNIVVGGEYDDAADTNRDGRVTSPDAMMIMQAADSALHVSIPQRSDLNLMNNSAPDIPASTHQKIPESSHIPEASLQDRIRSHLHRLSRQKNIPQKPEAAPP